MTNTGESCDDLPPPSSGSIEERLLASYKALHQRMGETWAITTATSGSRPDAGLLSSCALHLLQGAREVCELRAAVVKLAEVKLTGAPPEQPVDPDAAPIEERMAVASARLSKLLFEHHVMPSSGAGALLLAGSNSTSKTCSP
jgi:hypothetical protein